MHAEKVEYILKEVKQKSRCVIIYLIDLGTAFAWCEGMVRQDNRLEWLNKLPVEAFVEAFGAVFEHSPWVVEAAVKERPFVSAATLLVSCEKALYGASCGTQLELIRAHPDLAAKLDQLDQLEKLTNFSRAEQDRAGFGALPEDTLRDLRLRLSEYRERFGFPFILCVTEHPASAVLPILELRLGASAEAERMTCLFQIARIGWYRIVALLERAPAS